MEWGLELRADSRHADDIVKDTGLTRESKGLGAFGKERPGEGERRGGEMNAADARRHRASAARANYQD